MRPKILVIDDDLDTLKLTRMVLEGRGFRVISSSTGQAGLFLAKNEKPDLILLDFLIPDLNGIEITAELKNSPETESIPVLVFSSHLTNGESARSLEIGADRYLAKSAGAQALIKEVENLLQGLLTPFQNTPADRGEKSTLIGVTAPHSGVGISTLATNLAVVLHEQTGMDTILTDFRPGAATICLDLGTPDPRGMLEFLENKNSNLKDLLRRHPSGIQTLLSPYQPKYAPFLKKEGKFIRLTEQLRQAGSVIIIDLGPVPGPTANRILPRTDLVVLAMEQSLYGMKQSKKIHHKLVAWGMPRSKITPVLIHKETGDGKLTLPDAEQILGEAVKHSISPAPELAYQASLTHQPMVHRAPQSKTAREFQQLAKSIQTEFLGK